MTVENIHVTDSDSQDAAADEKGNPTAAIVNAASMLGEWANPATNRMSVRIAGDCRSAK